jgi:hypothetical protein
LETKLIKVLEWGEKVLRNKRVSLVKVLWRSSQIEKDMGKGSRDEGEVSTFIKGCRCESKF